VVAATHLILVIVMGLVSKYLLCKGGHTDSAIVIGCLTVLKVFVNNELVVIIQFMSSVNGEQ
jgi:hypothetical protein